MNTHLVFRFSLLLSSPRYVSASVRRDQLAWQHGTLVLCAGDVERLSGAVLTADDGAGRDLATGGVYPQGSAGSWAAGEAGSWVARGWVAGRSSV